MNPLCTTTRCDEPELSLAQAVVASLLRAGVDEVVVCAGARNAALVAVLAATPALRLWSFPEERSAAFFALGRALSLDAPVSVVTTSGTAVAELLPAVIEAHYQGVPLVLLTADRPRAYRGTGAPQAIEQAGLFGPYVHAAGDVAGVEDLAGFEKTLSAWDRRRPVHLNVCLEEPSAAALALAQSAAAEPRPAPARVRSNPALVETFLADTAAGSLVVVVAALPAAEQAPVARFLRRLGCPVIAEATSGLREAPELAGQRVPAAESTLARLPVGRVLRIGAVPSSRWWRDLEKRPGVFVLSLTPAGFPGLARPSLVADFPEWDRLRVPAGQGSPATVADPAASEVEAPSATLRDHPRSEPALIHALSAAIPPGSLVFLGNSLPIREWNVFATSHPRSLRCHANRGANGIDGIVSTFLGLGADEVESWAVIGDLTALFDLAALWITPSLPPARRRIAVVNNGGGRIFARVAALRGMAAEPQRLMQNPHTLGFRAWADMFGWTHVPAATAGEIAAAARRPEPNVLLEISPCPAQTEAAWATLSPDHGTSEPSHPAAS
jgi:2-succinyl-5-enolpyruvyl-6-hydroxy-3-cyclohexene-1-carboxylate synthase